LATTATFLPANSGKYTWVWAAPVMISVFIAGWLLHDIRLTNKTITTIIVFNITKLNRKNTIVTVILTYH
jgi:hypothetical protein